MVVQDAASTFWRKYNVSKTAAIVTSTHYCSLTKELTKEFLQKIVFIPGWQVLLHFRLQGRPLPESGEGLPDQVPGRCQPNVRR